MAINKLKNLGDGTTVPTTTTDPVITTPPPATESPSTTVGIVSADGTVVVPPIKPPIVVPQEEETDIGIIPVEIIEVISGIIPDFKQVTLDDVYSLLNDIDKFTYDRMSAEDKEAFRLFLEQEFADSTEFDEIKQFVDLAHTLINDNSLTISITTDSFQALDDLQKLIVESVANDAVFMDSKMETFIVTSFIHENPDATLNDLKVWLQFQTNSGGIVDAEMVKNSMWFINNSRSLTFAAWLNEHDFSNYNRTTVGPNAEQAQAQLAYMITLLDALRKGAKFGYKDFGVRDFAIMADKISLIYEAADLYGNALLQSIYEAFKGNEGDEEGAILAFLSSLAKYSPGLKELFGLLDEHSVTTEAMINTIIESILGVAPGTVERILGRKFLGEGGMREATTPLVIIGEVLFAILQTNDISKSYVDKVLDVWPLKTSDGVAFIPTTNGVYFYEPGTVGNNMKYFKNDWSGGVNTALMIVNALGKSKIPYAALIASVIKNGASILSLAGSYQYASKATNVLGDYNYDTLLNTLASKGSTYLTDWAINNQEAIQDTIIDVINPDSEEVPDTASSPLDAPANSPKGTGLSDGFVLSDDPIRLGGARRVGKTH